MQTYVLDFSHCKYLSQVHEELKQKLSFPSYYGGNLSALWDCMRDMAGVPCVIKVSGLRRDANRGEAEAAYVRKMVEVFRDVEMVSPEVHIVMET